MARSRMFDKVTSTWNPVTGCLHSCSYCWSRRLVWNRLVKASRHYRLHGFRPALNKNAFRRGR